LSALQSKGVTRPLSLGGQVAVFMGAAALVPMLLLLAVSYFFFAVDASPSLSFAYWSFLVVAWVLGSAFLIARVFSNGLARQLAPLNTAAQRLSQATDGAGSGAHIPEGAEIDDLARKFAEIANSLSQSQSDAIEKIRVLEASYGELKRLDSLKTHFLTRTAHELRTPLSAIVSAARIIQRYHAKDPAVVARFSDTIIAEGNRLATLVNDIRDLVRIEAGGVDWHDGEVRPQQLVTDAVSSVAPSAQQRHITVHVNMAPRLPVVWGDRDRLRQALVNVLDNAIKFSANGARVDVSVREAGEDVCFTVRDKGVGLQPAELAHALEAIPGDTRVGADGVSEGICTGLGLPICRGIVERHGGRVSLESEPGTGTTVHVAVPAMASRPTAVDVADDRLKVLLLVKDEVLADCAVRALRLEEIEGRVCDRFDVALETVVNWPPEIVIVSPEHAWHLNDDTERRLRAAGVGHILMFSQQQGFVELAPPTYCEPLLEALTSVVDRNASVLLVEDDSDYASVVDFELNRAGYRVRRAVNGKEAVAEVRREQPDAMLLDLAIPQLHGFGVLEHLEADGILPPTIVLTALDDGRLDDRASALGARAVFRKYELTRPRDEGAAARVKQALMPVFSANPTELSSELSAHVESLMAGRH
jgi:signal transduction histidine kinase